MFRRTKCSRIWFSAQNYAVLVLLLNSVESFISAWPKWSGGNVLYQLRTNSKGQIAGLALKFFYMIHRGGRMSMTHWVRDMPMHIEFVIFIWLKKFVAFIYYRFLLWSRPDLEMLLCVILMRYTHRHTYTRTLQHTTTHCHTHKHTLQHTCKHTCKHKVVVCNVDAIHTNECDSHVRMSCGAYMNESCHTYKWVTSHVWMSHVWRMN